MAEATPEVEAVFSLIETILQLFLAQRVAERLEIGKLADSVRIQLVDTSKSFLTDCLLVVSEKQAPELLPLEEVLPVVLGLGHSKDILVGI